MAALDVGAHTAGLVIPEPGSGGLRLLHDASAFTRLGEDLDMGASLSTEALRRALQAVGELSEHARRDHGPLTIKGVITSPGRRAQDPGPLVEGLGRLGVDARVISGEEEATLTWLGAAGQSDQGGPPTTVVDIGGGSTEIATGWRAGDLKVQSLDVGATSLRDALDRGEHHGLRTVSAAVGLLTPYLTAWTEPKETGRCILVSGTGKCLAYLQGADQAQGLVPVSREDVVSWRDKLMGLSAEAIEGLHPRLAGRGRILGPGCVILARLMDSLGVAEVLVSWRGLRHGLATHLAQACEEG